jgi:hypothetical protein
MLAALMWIIVVVLFVVWVVGLVLSWGGWVWISFVVAVAVLLLNLLVRPRPQT